MEVEGSPMRFQAMFEGGSGLFMANLVAETDFSMRDVRMMDLFIPYEIDPVSGEIYDEEEREERIQKRMEREAKWEQDDIIERIMRPQK